MKVALDTTNILGRGAVRDTYNLLADGIVKLLRALSQVEGISVREWAQARGYERYLSSSVKGEAAIDWSDKRARTALLAGIVTDADRLLELSRQGAGGSANRWWIHLISPTMPMGNLANCRCPTVGTEGFKSGTFSHDFSLVRQSSVT